MQEPTKVLSYSDGEIQAEIKVLIPNYIDRLQQEYRDLGSIVGVSKKLNIPFEYKHYGLEINLKNPLTWHFHTEDFVLDDYVRRLCDLFGVVIFINAVPETCHLDIGHKNRFPHLKFHYDRGPAQNRPYSLYTRDARDEEQMPPRASSTLFMNSAAGFLQAVRQGEDDVNAEMIKSNYDLFVQEFEDEKMNEILGHLVLEHKWNAPEGVSEVAIQDNRCNLHSSYYQNIFTKSYRIGVRYLD